MEFAMKKLIEIFIIVNIAMAAIRATLPVAETLAIYVL